jgi:hypothetical protein
MTCDLLFHVVCLRALSSSSSFSLQVEPCHSTLSDISPSSLIFELAEYITFRSLSINLRLHSTRLSRNRLPVTTT